MKAVLWTDALQGAVMFASLLAIVIAGVVEVGGFQFVVDRNEDTDRMNFFK